MSYILSSDQLKGGKWCLVGPMSAGQRKAAVLVNTKHTSSYSPRPIKTHCYVVSECLQ